MSCVGLEGFGLAQLDISASHQGQCRAGTVGVVLGVPEATIAPHSHADSIAAAGAIVPESLRPGPRPLLTGLPWAERGAGPLPQPSLRARGGHNPCAPSASALVGRAGPSAFREPGGRGKCALPLSRRRLRRFPSPCSSGSVPYAEPPSRRSLSVFLLCRGAGAEVSRLCSSSGRAAPGLAAGPSRGAGGVWTLGLFTVSALALCVCPQPPAGGKGSSPQHPRRQQLSFIPSRSRRERAVQRFHKRPCWCYTPLGLVLLLSEAIGYGWSGVQAQLAPSARRMLCSFHSLSASFFLPFPSNSFTWLSLHLFQSQGAGGLGATQHGVGDWFGLACILVEDSQEGRCELEGKNLWQFLLLWLISHQLQKDQNAVLACLMREGKAQF